MVAPQYFFSTLAQASAAIVGFVIAVAAALYTLERQRVERRTDEFREALTEFKNRYGFPLVVLSDMLESEGGNTTEKMTDDFSLDNEELEELVYDEYDEMPVTSLFLAHVRRILSIFGQIELENDYLLSDEELRAFRQSVDWIYTHFNQPDQISREVVEEIIGEPYPIPEDSPALVIFENYEEDYASKLEDWFEKRKEVEPEVLRPSFKDYLNDESHNEEKFLKGDNFLSIIRLVELLEKDFQKVNRVSNRTVIDYGSGIRPVLRVSLYLLLVGVILPTTFLLSSPVTFPMWFTLLSQVLLLLGTLSLGITLVEFVLRSAEPTNQMGDTENLSWFSSTMVGLLPNIPFE
jgi:hypothetical protein